MRTLPVFIRANKDAILERWKRRVQSLPSVRGKSSVAVLDHFPPLLEGLADALERFDTSAVPIAELPLAHAEQRYRLGFDLREIVAEYRELRQAIIDEYCERGGVSDDVKAKVSSLALMGEIVDRAVGDAVDHYAAEKERARETFIAMLGHDLRNPLQAIKTASQTILRRDRSVDDGTLRVAARIASSSDRMDAMIRDLLDFARAKLGSGIVITPVTTDLRSLVEDVVDEIALAHPDRQISCFARQAPGDLRGQWDSDRIAQAVSNLLSNAIAHGADPIVVHPFDLGDQVSIEVRNAGAIPSDQMPRLFEAFHPGFKGKRAGLGLGLFIVDSIAKAHGGRVDVTTSGDAGTAFTLLLPRVSSGTHANDAR